MARDRDRERKERRRVDMGKWAEEQERGFEPTVLKLPEGVEMFKLRPGNMTIDIIPYNVKNSPYADEGYEHAVRVYGVHRKLGPDNKQRYCCRADCWKQPCFICQWLNKGGSGEDKEVLKGMKSQMRYLYNVIDLDNPKKGIQVFDAAVGGPKHPEFGQLLQNKINAVADYKRFYYPEDGYSLLLKVIEDSWPGGTFNKVVNIEMVPRRKQYDPDIVDQAVCLDSILVDTPNEILRKAVLMEEDEEHKEEARGRSVTKPPSNGHKDEPKRQREEEEDEDLEEEDLDDKEEEEEEEEPRPVVKKNAAPPVKKKVKEEEEDLDDEDLEDEDDLDDDLDDDDDDDDDKPARRPGKKDSRR